MTTHITNEPLGLDAVVAGTDIAPEGFRWGWLGEDSELAFAVGHDVDEDAFARALELDEDDWNFSHQWMLATPHHDGCDGDCSCDEYGWWASTSDHHVPGSIAVTWWSA